MDTVGLCVAWTFGSLCCSERSITQSEGGRGLAGRLYAPRRVYAVPQCPGCLHTRDAVDLAAVAGRAARSRNSITHHITIPNLLRLVAVLAAAVALPFVLKRLLPRIARRIRVASRRCCGDDRSASRPNGGRARPPTLGLDRNVLAVLVTTALPARSGCGCGG